MQEAAYGADERMKVALQGESGELQLGNTEGGAERETGG